MYKLTFLGFDTETEKMSNEEAHYLIDMSEKEGTTKNGLQIYNNGPNRFTLEETKAVFTPIICS